MGRQRDLQTQAPPAAGRRSKKGLNVSSNITVEISADVTKLKTQLAVASAELRSSAAEDKAMAREYVGAADEVKASMLPQLEAATAAEAKLRAEVAKLNAELREQGEATGGLQRIEESIAGVGEKAEALNSRLAVFSRAGAAVGELAAAGPSIGRNENRRFRFR